MTYLANERRRDHVVDVVDRIRDTCNTVGRFQCLSSTPPFSYKQEFENPSFSFRSLTHPSNSTPISLQSNPLAQPLHGELLTHPCHGRPWDPCLSSPAPRRFRSTRRSAPPLGTILFGTKTFAFKNQPQATKIGVCEQPGWKDAQEQRVQDSVNEQERRFRSAKRKNRTHRTLCRARRHFWRGE